MAFFYCATQALVKKIDFWQEVFYTGMLMLLVALASLCVLFVVSFSKSFVVLPAGYYCGFGFVVLGGAILVGAGMRISWLERQEQLSIIHHKDVDS